VNEIVTGAGFEPISARRARRLRTLPDTVAPRMRLLVCGLNPSVVAADAGFGFAGATNRFWRAATEGGLITRTRDPLHALLVDGVGMTDLVKRATPGTKDLRADDYRVGARRVERLVRWLRPPVVLFVGLEGWRTAIDRDARAGVQPSTFGGATAYVMPSTSGLNAHARLADLVDHMRAAAEGI
jgi:TDG/mug DNA glycosylase family protein